MSIQTEAEFKGIQKVNELVGRTLRQMIGYVEIGMTTKEIDAYGAELMRWYGLESAPAKDYNFPGYTCISINHEICHGIPSANKRIKDGDLINIDVSAVLNGFYGDNGCSFVIGEDVNNLKSLTAASKEILEIAINKIKHGVRINEVGGTINREAKRRGYRVIKNLCGHGIGRSLHEPPHSIANFKDWTNRDRFKRNMVIALETFISTKATYAYQSEDQWTMVTRDDGFVAQHEHTLMVTDDDPIVLTRSNGF